MAITRRGLLARVAWGAALLLGLPGVARARERAREIHLATRNTLGGAIGVRLRRATGRPVRGKAWPGLPRIALPAPASAPQRTLSQALSGYSPAESFADTSIGRDTLARLLHYTNGVTGRGRGHLRLRAAPSAGALYAAEIYVLAERVDGLPAGVYAYSPMENALIELRRGSALPRAAAALELPERADGAAMALVITNVFQRYSARYANRGYRYALIDTGHIGENFRLSATSAGLAEWAPMRFHDALLNEEVGVDGRKEAVCALHFVGQSGPRGQSSSERAGRLQESHRSVAKDGRELAHEPERYHAWTQLVPAEEPTSARVDTPRWSPRARAPGDWLSLPEPASDTSLSVEATIAIRRSARRFATEPMDAAALAFILRCADGHRRLRRADGIELLVFVHRVDGVSPGLYTLSPDTRRLRLLRPGDLSGALVDVCLGQEKARNAAAGIAMLADIDSAAATMGDRSYRDLLIESGAIGQRIYLAAESLGLAARNLAAYVDEGLNDLVGVDGLSRAVVHLTMVGAGD